MLAKKFRLTSAEVRAILQKGRPVRAGSLSAKVIDAPGSKAAAVVSSKVAKTAVLRNKLRRELYSALGKALPRGVHAVVFLQKPTFDSSDLIALCSKLS